MKMLKKMMALVIACVFIAAPAQGAWSLVDDFEGSALGSVTDQTADNGQVWGSIGEDSRSPNYNTTVPEFEVQALNGGQSLVLTKDIYVYDRAWVSLGASIAEGTVGTIHVRVKNIDDLQTGGMNVVFGGYDGSGTKTSSKTTTMGVRNNFTGPATILYAGGVSGSLSTNVGISMDQWYECWIVIDLTAELEGVPDPTGFFYNCYAAGPGLDGILQFAELDGTTNFLLRDYVAGSGITMFTLSNVVTTVDKDAIAFDDIYVDYTGANLTSVPEPASLILLSLGSLVLWRKK